MEENQTLETLLKKMLTPIINEAIENAFARHHITNLAPPTSTDEVMNIKMTSEFLFLSVPTVYGLVNKRSIPYYKQGKRLYFRKDDLLKWISGGRRMTNDEISQVADQYILKTRKRQ